MLTEFPYNLQKASHGFKLKNKLVEISGLTYLGNNKVGCVQDELGKVYIFDLEQEKVVEDINFGKNRDYEGVQVVGKSLYILRSDGELLRIKDYHKKKTKEKKYNTFLKAINDAEGLGYDSKSNLLLIACKGSAGKGLKNKKAIYAFDLKKEKLQKKPKYTIDIDLIKSRLKQKGLVSTYEKIVDYFSPGKGSLTFAPSGIAVHPFTNEAFIISAVGKLLIVLRENGEIKNIIKLDSNMFKQPEGITFLENGDLLIANEGRGGKANILQFKYIKVEDSKK